MSSWKIDFFGKKPKLNKPILIEGLPGIGNVGKVAVDFIIEETKAKKIASFFSYHLPHSVFVNEENLVELPKLELYHARIRGKFDFLLLSGDVQPIDEISCYEFCDSVLDTFEELKGSEVVTLGGIAMRQIPKKPQVYCTGNSKQIIKKYKNNTAINDKLFGVVGPVIGVSGVLLGLAERRKISAISLLAETFGHPLYLGVNGSRELVKILNFKLELGMNLESLDKEIKKIEADMLARAKEITQLQGKMPQLTGAVKKGETSYIG
ncbi:MAG: PAC2 family protein [Nanoarchaeota archaeon]